MAYPWCEPGIRWPTPWAWAEQHNTSKGIKLLWALSHLDLLTCKETNSLSLIWRRSLQMSTVRGIMVKTNKKASSTALTRFQVIYSRKPNGLTRKVKGKFPQEITLRKTKQRAAFQGELETYGIRDSEWFLKLYIHPPFPVCVVNEAIEMTEEIKKDIRTHWLGYCANSWGLTPTAPLHIKLRRDHKDGSVC